MARKTRRPTRKTAAKRIAAKKAARKRATRPKAAAKRTRKKRVAKRPVSSWRGGKIVADRSQFPPRRRRRGPATSEAQPTADWPRTAVDTRILFVMHRLVHTYGFPVNGAAGLVGNLQAESGIIPQRIEGSLAATPMRAPGFDGTRADFTAEQIMNRSFAGRTGPKLPGIGLAQWTTATRRSGLFTHPFGGVALGAGVLFDMSAQIDYLVTEVRARYAGVHRVLTNAAVLVDAACDEVVYNFEVPGAILADGAKLPRTNAAVIRVFEERRKFARAAARLFTASAPLPG